MQCYTSGLVSYTSVSISGRDEHHSFGFDISLGRIFVRSAFRHSKGTVYGLRNWDLEIRSRLCAL